MEIFIGTSGWYYSWNEGGNFKWFIENSGLNSVELNASFYRFPFPNQIKAWAKSGKHLRWAIKVNRLITHVFKLDSHAFQTWKKFEKLFEPLAKCIDFYLFQLQPNTTPNSIEKIEEFIHKVDLGSKFALEFRNEEWFNNLYVNWAEKLGITLVSIDAPDLPRTIFNTSGAVYERIHGRSEWYSHFYSDEELQEIADKIVNAKPERAYVYFNNDHAMLENAQRMRQIFMSMKK